MRSDHVFPFYIKASLGLVGVYLLITMLYIGQALIVPLIYAVIIASVISPMVGFLVSKRVNRSLAILIAMVLLTAFSAVIITVLSSQLVRFSESFPAIYQNFLHFLDKTVAWVSANFNISSRKINLWISENNVRFIKEHGSHLGQTLVDTGSALVALVLIPVYVVLFLFYQPFLIDSIHQTFKESSHREVSEVLTATKKIIQSYLVGLLFEALIMAVLNSACLLIIGVDYAILLGVIGAVINVIPYLGGIIGVALPMLMASATGSASTVLLVLVSYTCIQFIDNNYIMPRIVASRVKINALVSLIVVLAGGALWGVPGMFLSIPITAIIKVVFDHVDSLKHWGKLLGEPAGTGLLKLKRKAVTPVTKADGNVIESAL
jgi:predicted PurR-regulated permease PerM